MTDTIVITRGNDRKFTIAVKDQNNAPADLTGVDLWFTAKQNLTDTDSQSILKKSTLVGGLAITNAVGGLAEVTVNAADTDDAHIPDPRARVLYGELKSRADGKVVTLDRVILVIKANVRRVVP